MENAFPFGHNPILGWSHAGEGVVEVEQEDLTGMSRRKLCGHGGMDKGFERTLDFIKFTCLSERRTGGLCLKTCGMMMREFGKSASESVCAVGNKDCGGSVFIAEGFRILLGRTQNKLFWMKLSAESSKNCWAELAPMWTIFSAQ